MKTTFLNRTNHGLTLVELLVVVAVSVLLLVMFLLANSNGRKAKNINCANNLVQVDISYRIWAGDNRGKYPMELSVTNGGTMELMNTGDAWRTYQVMSNELSTSRILYCPADEEHPTYATNFTGDLKGKISYLVGLDADSTRPAAILTGDDNFAIAGQLVKAGLISLSTYTPVAWTAARHHLQGNIGMADGSIQSVGNFDLVNRLRQTGLTTNRLVIP